MKVKLSVSISKEALEYLKEVAELERRTVSNVIDIIIMDNHTKSEGLTIKTKKP